MGNSALQRGRPRFFRQSVFPPNLAAALIRLRRSFWIYRADRLKPSPLIVRKKRCLCRGRFRAFCSCQHQIVTCRPFSGPRSARRQRVTGAPRQGRPEQPSKPSRHCLVSLQACIIHPGLRMVTGTGYRCKPIRALEIKKAGMPTVSKPYTFSIARIPAVTRWGRCAISRWRTTLRGME
jgi:hypothetical protein